MSALTVLGEARFLAESKIGLEVAGELDETALKHALGRRVAYLLNKRRSSLPQIFYALDLDEATVAALFAQPSPHILVQGLTDEIWRRLWQKAETRVRLADEY